MAHTIQDKQKLLHRLRRLRGQLNGVEKALEAERDCATVLLTLAACRGAMDALLAEIIEGHIRFHLLEPRHHPTSEQEKAAQDIISVVRRYLK